MKTTIADIPHVDIPEIVFGADMEKFKEFLAREDVKKTPWMDTPSSEYASTLFYKGGKLPETLREGVTEQDSERALRFFKACLVSFGPKHEDKMRVCGFVLNLVFPLDPEKDEGE